MFSCSRSDTTKLNQIRARKQIGDNDIEAFSQWQACTWHSAFSESLIVLSSCACSLCEPITWPLSEYRTKVDRGVLVLGHHGDCLRCIVLHKSLRLRPIAASCFGSAQPSRRGRAVGACWRAMHVKTPKRYVWLRSSLGADPKLWPTVTAWRSNESFTRTDNVT